MIEKYLITTADERTWLKNQPAHFLGEWCKRYSRKSVWEKLDADLVPYHWDDRKKLYADYKYLQKLYEKLLVDLSYKLNKIHSVEYSLRYWRIILGPWLGYFIQMLFDRWYMLGQALVQQENMACRILEREPLDVVPNDMAHFNQLYVEDDWNEAVYGQLLEMCWANDLRIEKIQKKNPKKDGIGEPRRSWKLSAKQRLWTFIMKISTLFQGDKDYFFISSYLPLKTDFRLQVRLGQFPKLWQTQSLPIISAHQRQWWLVGNIETQDPFEEVARKMIPQHIPIAYLEGYKRLVDIVDQCSWPSHPKAILTSNAYSANDLFKIWSAEKTELGTPLVIGQHGGHFGMTPFAFHEEHQIEISDKWISWGWSDQSKPKITPIGNLKGLGRKVSYDPDGGALMVEMAMPRYSYHLFAIPVSRQWLNYFEDQKKFLQALPEELREQVLVRLYSSDYGWDQKVRWQDQLPEINIDSGHRNISQLIEKSRLYISTYNATTYLESMTWNIPTIMFWNEEHWEIKEDVKPYFDLLKTVGIFHETPESAARQMVDVWGDISLWWESNKVQDARLQFCREFSNIPRDPLGELERVFCDLEK